MNILILTQYFYPDVASTGQLLTELSVGLSSKKIDVEVITASPSYSYRIPASKNEDYLNVKIKRVWSMRLSKNNRFGQIMNSVTFFTSVFLNLLFKKDLSNLLIVSNPPFLPLMGYIFHKIKGVKFIYLVHDVFPDKAIKLNYISKNSFIETFWKIIDQKILKSASIIIVLGETMKSVITKKFERLNIPGKEKIRIIHNWADEDFIKPCEAYGKIFREEYELGDKFIVQYSGNLGASYDLEKIMEVAKITVNENIVFMFIGDGIKKQKLQQFKSDNNLKNVIFLPYLEKAKLPYSLNCADISLLTYEEKLEGLLMPSKLYTILATGTPVIALCKKGSEIDNIITEADCGFSVYDNIVEFNEQIEMLYKDKELRKVLGTNARKYFESNHTLERSVNLYYDAVEELNKCSDK